MVIQSFQEAEESSWVNLASILNQPIELIKNLDTTIANIFFDKMIQCDAKNYCRAMKKVYQSIKFEELSQLSPCLLRRFMKSFNYEKLSLLCNLPQLSSKENILLLNQLDEARLDLFYDQAKQLSAICQQYCHISLEQYLHATQHLSLYQETLLLTTSRSSIMEPLNRYRNEDTLAIARFIDNCLIFQKNPQYVAHISQLSALCKEFNITFTEFFEVTSNYRQYNAFIIHSVNMLTFFNVPNASFKDIFDLYMELYQNIIPLYENSANDSMIYPDPNPLLLDDFTRTKEARRYLYNMTSRDASEELKKNLEEQNEDFFQNGTEVELLMCFNVKAIFRLLINNKERYSPIELDQIKRAAISSCFLHLISKKEYFLTIEQSDKIRKIKTKLVTKQLNYRNVNEKNFTLLLPAGWKGHAIICGVHKKEKAEGNDQYSFSIWNTGGGVSLHPARVYTPYGRIPKTKFQIQMIWSNLTFEQISNPDFLFQIFNMKNLEINHHDYYESIHRRFEKTPDLASSDIEDYHDKQPDKNCGWKSYWRSFADLLGPNSRSPLTLKVKEDFIEAALHFFKSSLSQNDLRLQNQEQRDVKIINNATRMQRKIERKRSVYARS